MALPEIVSREEWTKARKALLEREKELTRARDALVADRRRLPMVEVDDYRFTGPDGEVTLRALFGDKRQLIVGHFMFDPRWEKGCPSCTAGAEEVSAGLLDHLASRDTAFSYVSRAPIDKIERYKQAKGWDFSWVSSHGTRFNHDFGVTLDPSVQPPVFNYRPFEGFPDGSTPDWPQELPGISCFLRVDDRVFHTYSTFARGGEQLGGSYYWLDLTALGRQEDWEEPKGRAEAARAAVPRFDD